MRFESSSKFVRKISQYFDENYRRSIYVGTNVNICFVDILMCYPEEYTHKNINVRIKYKCV